MKCLKCSKSVKGPTALSWETLQWCPECYDKSRFQDDDVLKIHYIEFVPKGDIIRLKSTPVDFFLDKFTQREIDNHV